MDWRMLEDNYALEHDAVQAMVYAVMANLKKLGKNQI